MNSVETKHVKAFKAEKLRPEEIIQSYLEGWIGDMFGTRDKKQHNGMFILTNERACFYRKGVLGEVFETIPISNITSIETLSNLGHRTLRLHTSNDEMSFKTFETKELFDQTHAAIEELRQRPSPLSQETKPCPDCAESVKVAARKCRFCGYEFGEESVPVEVKAETAKTDTTTSEAYVSLEQIEKPEQLSSAPQSDQDDGKEKQKKFIGIGCLAFVGLGILFTAVGSGDGDGNGAASQRSKPAAETMANAAESPEEKKARELKEYADQLEREIESMQDGNRMTDMPDNMSQISAQIVLMSVRAILYKDRPRHESEDVKKLEREFIRLSTQYQRDAFPKLRKAYADELDKIGWESDIDVAAIGSGNRILRFTAGAFAANRNIKTAHDALKDMPSMLRFREVRYEWYRGSSWQGYDYDTALADGDWAHLGSYGWIKFD